MKKSKTYLSVIDKSKVFMSTIPFIIFNFIQGLIILFSEEMNIPQYDFFIISILATIIVQLIIVVFTFNIRYNFKSSILSVESLGFDIVEVKYKDILYIDKKKRKMQVMGLSESHFISLKIRNNKTSKSSSQRPDEVSVSPLDVTGFIEELLEQNPDIEVFL